MDLTSECSRICPGDSSVTKFTWNGKPIKAHRTPYSSLVGTAPGAETASVVQPAIDSWKAQDTLPETKPEYDDPRCTVCNKSVSVNLIAPLSLPVPYSGDHGYRGGIKIYRGRFDGQDAIGANVTVRNGVSAGWTACLNGEYIGGALGSLRKYRNHRC